MKHIGRLVPGKFVNNGDGPPKILWHKFSNLKYKYAPCKIKHVRVNQMPFFDKRLSKQIMTWIKLRNTFLQNKSEENRKFCET